MPDPVERALWRWGWADATRHSLAGDASSRRYLRLWGPGGRRAVLMCAPPAEASAFDAFCAVAGHLRAAGHSAPLVIAADRDAGLMLLEDLGDALFARLAGASPSIEAPLYGAATAMLGDLADMPPPPCLPRLDPAGMAGMIQPAFDFYVPGMPDDAAAEAMAVLAQLLARHADGPPSFALRDCHAENLIWLPHRHGSRRMGLLDFQDAVMAPAGYDLVSLLDDARRDVCRDLACDLRRRFAARRGIAPEAMEARAAVLSLQRNLRILGIFARLAQVDGKARFLDYLPRVHAHVDRALDNPACAPLRGPLACLDPATRRRIA